ncbi:MAG: hypothetical protein IPK39_23495 [Sulfuritalea sp.]|nr:hypothetical protein [Sulfuritalea sp.]
MGIFVGPNFVLSARSHSEQDLFAVRERCEREPELLRQGAGFVAYAIMDSVVDRYFLIIDTIESEQEDLEGTYFRQGHGAPRLYDIMRRKVALKPAVAPRMDALASSPAVACRRSAPTAEDWRLSTARNSTTPLKAGHDPKIPDAQRRRLRGRGSARLVRNQRLQREVPPTHRTHGGEALQAHRPNGSSGSNHVVLLGVTVAILVAFQRLHIPSSLGYLLVGLILGPHTAGPTVHVPRVQGFGRVRRCVPAVLDRAQLLAAATACDAPPDPRPRYRAGCPDYGCRGRIVVAG